MEIPKCGFSLYFPIFFKRDTNTILGEDHCTTKVIWYEKHIAKNCSHRLFKVWFISAKPFPTDINRTF